MNFHKIRLVLLIVFGLCVSPCLFAIGSVGETKDNKPALPVAVAEYSADDWILVDRNGDGKIDYALKQDKNGTKICEAFDCNYDGRMDNFYFYETGVLARQEIDTKFVGKIDLWVYLYQGVYISAYERANSDGVLSLVKVFGSKTAAGIAKNDKS